jgi:hypothetical protein
VRRLLPGETWPAYDESEKVRAIARRKVAPLAMDDARLTEALARICARAAAYHYEHLTPSPGTVSFTIGRRR